MLSPWSWVTVLACSAVGACSIAMPIPQARVRRGPAYSDQPQVVFALPAACTPGAIEHACAPDQLRALSSRVWMALEFDGHRLVDAERVNAYLRRRIETEVEWKPGGVSSHRVKRTAGSWFLAPPRERQMMLEEMGIDSVLELQIDLGRPYNLDGERTLLLSLVLRRLADGTIVWTSRCSVETGGNYHQIDQALQVAARCSVESTGSLRS